MYDPTIGRWLSEDPIGFEAGDPNLYRYVGNRSTTQTDPTGLFGGWGSASAEQWGISNHSPNKKRRPSVYAYYLCHPWEMDDDLETGFYIAGGGGAAAGALAGGLVIAGVGSVTVGTASSVAGMITAELADTAVEAGISAATGYDVFFPVSPLDLGQDLGKYSIKKGLRKCASGSSLDEVLHSGTRATRPGSISRNPANRLVETGIPLKNGDGWRRRWIRMLEADELAQRHAIANRYNNLLDQATDLGLSGQVRRDFLFEQMQKFRTEWLQDFLVNRKF